MTIDLSTRSRIIPTRSWECNETEWERPFYGYWQPAPFKNAPLLIHTPVGGGEIMVYPDIVMQGYNEWLTDCVIATECARRQPGVLADRLSFFGTSQGGFGSLLLGSLYSQYGVHCVAAEEPFGINFPMVRQRGKSDAYQLVYNAIEEMDDPQKGWYAAGMIDPLSHARRLTMPVLLTAGSEDHVCPDFAIHSLFEELKGNKLFYTIEQQGHECCAEFVAAATMWFRMYG